MARDLDIGALFPSLAEELGEHAALLEGEVLNAGAGHRDLRSLVPGRVHNQDIPEGLHNDDIDILSPLHEVPVGDAFFDAIVCNAVLEHVANPEQVMAEFARVCKPGGVLYLCVPFMQPEHLDPTDFQRYTRDGLKLLVERHGFEVRDAEGVHNVYVTLGWLAREWLTASDRLRFRFARWLLFPWIARKARTSKLHVHSLASAYKVIATRSSEGSSPAPAEGSSTTTKCFMHVPKSGGVSVRQALEKALPDGFVAPQGIDADGFRIFSDFTDFEQVREWARVQLAITDPEISLLNEYPVVTGHFPLATLLRVAHPRNIATVLREPRARLLSLYLFFRMPLVEQVWGPYRSSLLSDAARSLDAFLTESGIARATDNQVCRMILRGDSRIPKDGFISPADAESIAVSALTRLDQFGYVGILESGETAWQGLSRMFGVALEPARVNESSTPAAAEGTEPIPPFDVDAALDGLDQRSIADRIVYESILARICGGADRAHELADASFTEQLERFDQVNAATGKGSVQVAAAVYRGRVR